MNAEQIKTDILKSLNSKQWRNFDYSYDPKNILNAGSSFDKELRNERIAIMSAVEIIEKISCEGKTPEEFLAEVDKKTDKLYGYAGGSNAKSSIGIKHYKEELSKNSEVSDV